MTIAVDLGRKAIKQTKRSLEVQGFRYLYPQNYDHKRELKKLYNSILANFLDIFLSIIFSIYMLGAQKNHLIETILLSTHNICFG